MIIFMKLIILFIKQYLSFPVHLLVVSNNDWSLHCHGFFDVKHPLAMVIDSQGKHLDELCVNVTMPHDE
jgi:hypothetical protein